VGGRPQLKIKNMNCFLKYNKLILMLLIGLFITKAKAQSTENIYEIVTYPSPKGVFIRVVPADTNDLYLSAKAFIIKKIDAKNKERTIGRIKLTTDAATFAQLLGGELYAQFMAAKEFKTEAEVTAFLGNKDNLDERQFFGGLDIRYMVAFGFGFLDREAKPNEVQMYNVVKVDKQNKETETITASAYNQKNPEIAKVKTNLARIDGADSSVSFKWYTDFPVFSKKNLDDLPFDGDTTGYDGARTFITANAEEFSKFELFPNYTHFKVYYRINNQLNWRYNSNQIAGPDSTGKRYILAKIPCLPEDLVETIVIPEDYAFNMGDTSKIARGVAVTNNSIELIYGLNSVDSTNSIALSWKQLSKKPYYTGIELSKSWGDEAPKVIATMPVDATNYQDMDVYPAGQIFTYYIRPLFLEFQDLKQEAPALAMQSCTKFSRPLPPFNVKAEPLGKLAKITWEAIDNKSLHSYHVYRGTSPEAMFPVSSNVFTKEYIDSTDYLSPTMTYFYSVMAMSLTQDTSVLAPYVNYVPVKKLDIKSPPLIGNEIVNDDAILTWDDVRLNDDYIDGYLLQRKKKDEKAFITLHEAAVLHQNSFTDTTFQRGVPFVYRIASVSIKGDTAQFSPEIDISAIVEKEDLAGITDIKLTNLSKTIRIEWPAVEGQNITQYKVYKKLPTEANFKLLATLPNGNFEYEDVNLKAGTTYVYTVTALDNEKRESDVIQRKSIYREAIK
jgi:fibronectin type 3 domain-containing protein